jgi:hypothetical protein
MGEKAPSVELGDELTKDKRHLLRRDQLQSFLHY